MHVLHMAKHQFVECRRGPKLEHSYVPGNQPRDNIDWLKKAHSFHI